jgi:hypothetical protein
VKKEEARCQRSREPISRSVVTMGRTVGRRPAPNGGYSRDFRWSADYAVPPTAGVDAGAEQVVFARGRPGQ